MSNRTVAAILGRLGVIGRTSTGGGRWTPRPADEHLRAFETPRRVSLFGPRLQPKTVPVRRIR